MDKAALKREQSRILRGRILEILHEYFGVGALVVGRGQIERLVDGFSAAEVDMAINYLSMPGKEYIRDATKRLDHLDRSPARDFGITAAGIDLVEGGRTDEGVVFGN